MKLFSAPPRPTGTQRPASDTAQQRPAQQRPAQQRPAQQRPAQQRPAQQRPAQQRPAQQRPAQQRPAQQRPAQQRPAQQRPAQQRPAQQRPAQQRPAQQRPTQQRPAQQRPAQQRPAQQRPTQQAYASQWTDDAARPRRSAPDNRRRAQQAAPAGKHGRKAKKAKKPKKKKSLGRRLLILFLVLAILAGLYLTAVYSDIPFIAKWRTAYIQTAMNTLSHQWLATAFIPRSVIDKVVAEMEAAREAQIGVNTEWDEEEIESRNPTLTDTKGMSKEEIAFYNLFWEVDVPSMQAYVKEHPDALAAGWSRINIDKSALTDDGTSIRTIQGEQVLAIDAQNEIMIARVKGSTYRGVLVIMKDPSRLSLQAASTLGSVGQVCGKIAEAHGGVIGMTGSGFIDPGGTGNGGTLAGYAMCNGKSYGGHMGYGYKRLELHEDNRIYIRDSDSEVSPGTTDAVEFSPAMIIDGETVVNARSGFSDLQPRACLGQSKYGEIIALLVEGRLTTSVGISVPDCAAIMAKHDCMQAMNLDGGTSAMIWYKGKYIMRSSNPALTAGRTLPNAFVYAGK
ncbi:MAG: phosphodiester glycosidase family protein [Oscillospiraceae bacterium]|nr:phosphodiester glycosidase family protein [Oscillospiraceae bacterium]